jgi:PKD repeat protein
MGVKKMKSRIFAFAVVLAALLYVGSAYAAVSVGSWVSNGGTTLTVYNTESAEFTYGIQAVTSQGGRYSIYLYREGSNTPLRTYSYNTPTINNGATGYITITPNDYLSTPGNYYVVIYSVDSFGADTFYLNLVVTSCIMPSSVTCTANPTSGNAPLNVNFNAYLTGGSGHCLLYEWTFNDGLSQSTSQSFVSHNYINPGTYAPTLRVTDGLGHYAYANCNIITVNQNVPPITASCNINPRNGQAPLNTHLTATASGGSGSYNYQWIFGDGFSDITSSNSIYHTYQNSGTFNARLNVSDSHGRSTTVSCGTVTVSNAPPLTATCNVAPRNGQEPLNAHFTASASGGSGYSYHWNFNDGQTTTTSTAFTDHTYTSGNYAPSLTVSDSIGRQVTVSCGNVQVSQFNQLYVSCEASPTSGEPNTQVSFIATPSGGSGTYNTYLWNFGNGITLNTYVNNVRYNYYLSGTYNPTVQVRDNLGQTAIGSCPTISIQQTPPLTLTCNANPTNGNAPLSVYFDAVPNGGSGSYTQYSWYFGDGQSQSTADPNSQHTYSNSGTFYSRVTVTDSRGRTVTANCPVIRATSAPAPLTATCSVNPRSGNAPLNSYFTSTASGGSGGYIYTWTFDDGQTQTSSYGSTSHLYNTAGNYHPILNVRDSQGNTVNADCGPVNVYPVTPPLTVSCSADPTNGTSPLNVWFQAVPSGGSGSYTNFRWQFGDSSTQNTADAYTQHTYNSAGYYYSRVTVTDSMGRTATGNCPTIRVTQSQPPLTGSCAVSPTSGTVPLYTYFTGTASGGSGSYTYFWNYDDGSTRTTYSRYSTHLYNVSGQYDATLTITDANGNSVVVNCPHITVNPRIDPLSVTCTANPTSGIVPLDVDFHAQATGGTGVYYSYQWIFGDGQSQTTNDPFVEHTYFSQGTFYSRVIVSDSQGRTATGYCPSIRATPQVPQLNATCSVSPRDGIAPMNTYFTSTATGGSGGYSYTWTFDDGTTAQTSYGSISHVYNNVGIYNPHLVVRDNQGRTVNVQCGDVNVHQAPDPLTISCDANPRNGTAPLDVFYIAYVSGGSGVYNSYQWTFGDSTSSTSSTNYIDHRYNGQGTYYGTVRVTDSKGRSASTSCPMIRVNQPVSPVIVSCTANPLNGEAPLNTLFTSTASGGVGGYTYHWSFGDGTNQDTSTRNTNHVYNAGVFYPLLTVTDSNGNSGSSSCGCVTATQLCSHAYQRTA